MAMASDSAAKSRMNASLSLVYNSNVWNKSTNGRSTFVTYDVHFSWPATGWRITLGQIEDQGSAGFTLTEMDGTRRALVYTSAYNYDTTDGSRTGRHLWFQDRRKRQSRLKFPNSRKHSRVG